MSQNKSAADSHELRPLTGIRGLAAFMVIMFHFNGFTVLFRTLHVLDPLWSNGGMGVDLFFILSGFILTYVYSAGSGSLTSKQYLKFLWFRFARLYPNHLATLVLLGSLVISAKFAHVSLTGSYPAASLPYQLTLTHAWPYSPGSDGSQWNYPSWSISAEWFAYVFVFPVAWFFLRKGIHLRWQYLPLAYGVLIFWLVLSCETRLRLFFPLLNVSLEFLSGSLLFGLFRNAGCKVICIFQQGLDSVFLFMLASFFAIQSHPGGSPWMILFFPCILLGLTAESSFVARCFSTPVALWFGNISYSLYMTHAVTMKMLKIILPMEKYAQSIVPVRLCLLVLHLAAIIAVAAGFYYMVEFPARNALRRVSNPFSSAKS